MAYEFEQQLKFVVKAIREKKGEGEREREHILHEFPFENPALFSHNTKMKIRPYFGWIGAFFKKEFNASRNDDEGRKLRCG